MVWWPSDSLQPFRVEASRARPPSSRAIQKFLERTIQKNGAKPKYIITDKGSQFWCDGFKGWCKGKKIKPRFGAKAMTNTPSSFPSR